MLSRLSRLALLAASLLGWALFVGLALARIRDPVELGNGEGAVLDHVARLAHGQPIYVEPSLHFIPFIYMPLYPLVVAALSRIVGVDFWVARMVSVVSTLGLAAIVAWIVTRETKSITFGLAGSAILLMGFGLTRGNYDLAQPNSLMLLLVVLGLAVLRFSEGRAGAIVAALLLAAAFFAKQTAALFGVAAVVAVAFTDRRRFLPFAVTWAAGCAGTYLLLALWLGPWFDFYVRQVPRGWVLVSVARIQFLLGAQVLGTFAILSIPALLTLAAPQPLWRGREALWMWVGLAGVVIGLVHTLDAYAYYHTLMPTIVALALVGPIALHRLIDALTPEGSGRRATAFGVAHLLLVLQFLPLLYPARTLLPPRHRGDVRAEFLAKLNSYPQGVMIPLHGYYTTSAGQGSWLHVLPLDDILRSRGNRLLKRDPQFFERMFAPLRSGPHRPVILSDLPLDQVGDASRPLWASLASGYALVDSLGELSEALRPVKGDRETPRLLYAPR